MRGQFPVLPPGLQELLGRLNPSQLELLVRMAAALGSPVDVWRDPGSDICTDKFAAAAGNFLALHHATHFERLNKKGFEFLFKFSSEADGRVAVLNTNSTDSAEDIRVNGVSYSLKTQADRAIKRSAIYIQKLMEARWIRECKSRADFARQVQTKVAAHLSRYERIVVLRGFPPAKGIILYDLVEIPKKLLERMTTLTASDFSGRNEYGSSGANVTDERGVAFRVLLDGSVEKVRIFNLRIDRCFVHGVWNIPISISNNSSEETVIVSPNKRKR